MIYTARAQRAIPNSPRRSLAMPRNALGRGVGALIREPEAPAAPAQQPAVSGTVHGSATALAREPVLSGPQQNDIDLIEPSPYQPPTRLRQEALDEPAR